MGRSSGARPRKAVREEVLALKAQLGTITADRWQVAQAIFSQICALCDVEGPSRGKMVPRACRFCGYYGHTRQHCAARLARQEALDKLDPAFKYRWPESRADCPSDEHWAWIQELNAIHESVRRRRELGMGCERGVCHECADCEAWYRAE